MSNSKTAVVTGSTGGIGGEIAQLLASKGWNLILVNRSAEKAADQIAKLKSAFPEIAITSYNADLSDLDQIRATTAEIVKAAPKIDALYNITGILTSSSVQSRQGHEIHYAINVLAEYLVTHGLRPALKREASDAPTMVVTMSSSSINGVGKLEVEELVVPKKLGLLGAYAKSKMALTIMSAEISDDLKQDNILIRAIDPGPTRTPMTTGGDGMPGPLRLLAPLLFSSPDKQAAKVVFAADPAAFGGRTGIMVSGGKEKPLPKLAKDPKLKEQLMSKLIADAGQ
ncbi:MAG: SDR family NAD(P)-dependent oxidoreductase [Pseudomonadota bacterium]